MADAIVNPVDLAGVEKLVGTTDALVREALEVASKRTEGGKGIDDEQVHCERLAYAATEARAARDLLTYAAGRRGAASPIRASRRWPASSPARAAPSCGPRSRPIRTSSASATTGSNATLGIDRDARV